jgi:K+/H+ antiporter YhaU regulatory subunit KhtT
MILARNILIAFVIVFSITGCSAVQLVVSFAPEMQRLRDGEREFELGNFHEAEKIFAEIFDSKVSLQTRNTALYNLACTRIITAENSADFIAAVDLFEAWEKTHPSVIYVENPNLVITALQTRSSLLMINTDETLQQQTEINEVITTKDAEIKKLKAVVDKLQHQITELQAIDQQLMEKRKPL